jgi:hypothetical protein
MAGSPGFVYEGSVLQPASDGTYTIAPVSSNLIASLLGQGWVLTAFTK